MVGPAQLAVDPRRDHQRPGHRRQRPDGPARRQPPRARDVLRHLQRPADAAELRALRLLDSAAHRFYPDWERAADTAVAILRTSAGRNPHDKALHDLVGELSTRSDEFRRRWSAHNVRTHGSGVKYFHHHVVGDLTLAWESVDLRAEPGLTMTIYTAEPGSPTEHALALLGSWAATPDAPSAEPHTHAEERAARRT
jgi:hypothetical protein